MDINKERVKKEIWIYGEGRQEKINQATYELISEAKRLSLHLDAKVIAILIGYYPQQHLQELIAYGADEVHLIEVAQHEKLSDEIYIEFLYNKVCKHIPEIFLFSATTISRSIASAIASRLNTGLTADCTKLEIDTERGLLKQMRPAFGGNLMATIVCDSHRPQMATIRPKVMTMGKPDYCKKGIIYREKQDVIHGQKVKVLEEVLHKNMQDNITDADVIITVGRGIGSKDNLKVIEELADIMGASIGGTRAVVDIGWLDYTQQIGQTGRTVNPKLYIALGVSGAIQHLVGMTSAKTIIAINSDPNAPIFNYATYGIVGDLLDIIPSLVDEIALAL